MAIKESITIDEIVNFLNELLEIDRSAIAVLLANRTSCNEELAKHPSVQVMAQNGGYNVGMFGILNGLFGTFADGWGSMQYIVDDNRNLLRFERVKREE